VFDLYRDDIQKTVDSQGNYSFQLGAWKINGYVDQGFYRNNSGLPLELVPASSLTFKGLRNMYRRDGVGAELVAVRSKSVMNSKKMNETWSQTPFPAVSVVMRFTGGNLDEVLATHEATLIGFDPYQRDTVELANKEVPLAANFTSAYGLWLARSGFAWQALLTLIGRGDVLERPHVFMMQPYDPNRRIIVMLHGLASSPEAWINVANEVLGDVELRKDYQIWQVYYPTNIPMIVNHYTVQKAIEDTLHAVDPAGTAPSSQGIVLIGHSMGGVLVRLMVSEAANLWDRVEQKYDLDDERLSRLQDKLGPYGKFRPIKGVDRAIFVATPHRGTPFAENRFARWMAGLVSLPGNLVSRFTDMAQIVVGPTLGQQPSIRKPLTSIGSLSDRDPFIQLTSDLPISNNVSYHSIIGNDTPDVDLSLSSDGVVPYESAHLPGAISEVVIPSWHSVQETPEAIVEIRRILHLHLKEEAALKNKR
jgi:triacylglycerol esterase/lipase EstA (alpha/beta hydrolase family)